MADLFFYGTLRHVPLLELVLDRAADVLDIQPAVLQGHGAFAVVNECFPTIELRDGHAADGVLVRGLSSEDLERLNFYEGGFSYDLKPVSVDLKDGSTASCEVYFPQPGLWRAGDTWDLNAWFSDWGDMSMRAAEEVMSYFGRVSAEEMARRITPIRIRAAAWVAAQMRQAEPKRDLSKDVVVHRHNRSHLSFFGLEEMDLQFRRFDGTMSEIWNRSALMVGQAAVVLPYDPVRDRVLLIEQFRAPPFIAGATNPWIWEAVAGLVDPGETPEQTAYREAVEEAGLELLALEPVAQVYSSTGSSGEFAHIFVGLAELTEGGAVAGLASEGEDIRSRILSYQDLMDGVDAQTYCNAQLVTAALWLSRHRERLRKAAQVVR
ncbi:MAG: NUDIX domain-containing protein [Rhodobacteraceae bacterium]|nr:NUDIX domain-containing protein [Paracoccaceae bacterium]